MDTMGAALTTVAARLATLERKVSSLLQRPDCAQSATPGTTVAQVVLADEAPAAEESVAQQKAPKVNPFDVIMSKGGTADTPVYVINYI
jgi:hypothetical protein